MLKNLRLRILLLAVLLFTMGCLCLPSSITPTPVVNAVPIPVGPTPIPTVTVGPTAPQPPASSGNLNANGPWLLLETDQGLYATNPDGSGLTRLTDEDYWHGEIASAIQPGGSQIAFITPSEFDFHHMALNLLLLPSGQVVKVTDLTSPSTEPYADSFPGDPGFETLRAIGERRSFAWSPDGNRLAFIGAMDGPTADVYIYYAHTGDLIPITNDSAQDFAPSWSPDSSTLLYMEAEGFGTGAGIVLDGIWSINPDGSNASMISGKSSGADIVGWLDNTTAVIDTWNITCGPGNLRLYDVNSRHETVLVPDCINSAAATSLYNAALYSTSQGVYMLTAADPSPVQVSQQPNLRIDPWGPDDQAFIVRTQDGSISTFGTHSMDHQVSPVTSVSTSALPFDDQDVAMYGAIWAWTSQVTSQPGAWITGPGIEVGQVYSRAARFPAWDPHNNLLFFAVSDSGGYDLYRDTFDSHYTDLALVTHLPADLMATVWLGPK